jgi:glycerol-3-phosphate cytidylyltransferase
MKNILVDMSATLIHHGHIRLLKKASKFGRVIVALTNDKEIKKTKGYKSELNFNQRKEVLLGIKYVYKVISSKWSINEKFLKKNKIDYLVHGNDCSNPVSPVKKIIFKRTKDISSNEIRKKIIKNFLIKQKLLKLNIKI